jgi:elongation factor G
MRLSRVEAVRNVALVGHGAVGKTSLAERMLFDAGMSSQLGSVDEGTSLLDCDAEERSHHFSTSLHLAHFERDGREITLLDTPGYPDFIGQVIGALRGVETACIVLSASAGIEANTRRVFRLAGEAGLGRMFVLNKLDCECLDLPGLVSRVRAAFGPRCVLLNVPNGLGRDFTGVIDTLDLSYEPDGELPIDPRRVHQTLMDAIMECDDELMERYLSGDGFSKDELEGAVEKAIAAGSLIPILCTSAKTGVGVPELMDILSHEALCPRDLDRTAIAADGEPVRVEPDEQGQLVAQVFKNRIDPYVSKLSYLRVYAGTLHKDSSVVCPTTGKNFRITNLFRLQGNVTESIEQAVAGDICAVMKLDDLHVGDTLIDEKNGRLSMPPLRFPRPMIALGIEPRSQRDQVRISTALHRIAEEDPTFHASHDEGTQELVMRGMSELHLQIVEERLHAREKVDVVTHPPRIPYRETIKSRAEGMYRHKKQSGGAGQFAEVHLRVYPFPAGMTPEQFMDTGIVIHFRDWRHHPERNLLFIDAISGGSVPNQFIPAIERGILERMEQGGEAGFPVCDVAVELFFGKAHDVDSNEQAFRTAAAWCFRQVFSLAKPTVLEPVITLEVLVPADKVGEVMCDLGGRKARIEQLEPLSGGDQMVTAKVPLAAVSTYARTLQSLTGGGGSFTMELSHYAPMPLPEQARLLAEGTSRHERVERELCAAST